MLNPSTHNDDINRLRFDHAALRFKWELIKRAHYGRKYRPNQLRIPRGKDFAGRFANEGNRRPKPQQAFLPAEAVPLVVEKTIVAGVALNLALSNRGAGEKKPIITFNAKEYRDGKLDVESVAAFGIGQFRVRARDLRALCDGKHKGPQKPQTRQRETKWLAWEREVCDYMIGTVCPLVAAEDKVGIARWLHNLEAEAVKKQKLHKLWELTPFPIELEPS